MDISHIKESLRTETALPDYSLFPELVTANIDEYVAPIRGEWTTATQTTTPEGEIFSRTYSVLSYPASNHPDAQGTVVQVNGVNPEPYDGFPFYYSVSTYFYETVYSSSRELVEGNSAEDFLRWRRDRIQYRHEMVYSHRAISSTTWCRPLSTTTPQPGEPAVITYPRLQPSALVLPLISANSAIAAQVTATNSNYLGTEPVPTNCAQAPISLNLNNNSPVRVELVSSPTDPQPLLVTNPTTQHFLLRKPFIRVTLLTPDAGVPGTAPLTAAQATHKAIRLTFYGTYKWSSYLPVRTISSDTLRHRVNSSMQVRLRPPGLQNLTQNFWNSNLSTANQIENFNQRFVAGSSNPTGQAWTTTIAP